MPLALSEDIWARRDLRNLFALGKLKPGETVGRARTELNTLEAQLGTIYPATMAGWHVMVEPIRTYAVGEDVRNSTKLLLLAVAFALLLVCANIANLQFVRGSGRVKEIAIRVAMGGSRWRIVRQLLTESTLIALAGAGLGTLIAVWTIKIVILNMPADVSKTIAGWDQIHVDGRTLIFAIVMRVCLRRPCGNSSGVEKHANRLERNAWRKAGVPIPVLAQASGCGVCWWCCR